MSRPTASYAIDVSSIDRGALSSHDMDSKKACDKESISNLRLAAAVFAGAELKACRVL